MSRRDWLWLALVPAIIYCKGLVHASDKRRLPTTAQRQTQTVTTSYDTINGRSCYRSIAGMNQFMKDLAANYPDLVTMETIGESYIKKNGNNNDGRSPGYDIYALNITAANSTRQSSEKGKLLITSGIHAREYTPTELLARFIEMLINGYNNNDAQITSILQHTEIHAVIHVNPDGRYMAENFSNTYWRKNMNLSGCKNEDFYGVDINRNFDFLWGDESGASSNPCADEYHGTGPNSEEETQALVNYAMRVFPESQRRSDPEKQMDDALGDDIMGMYVDIHSTGEYIYYPWGHRDKTSPDDDAYQAIARKMSHYNGYDLWASGFDFVYPVSGDSSDYMYAVMGVSSMGLELGFNFYDNCDTFEKDILPSNLDVLLYAASIAGRPFSLAKGPDVLDVTVVKIDGELIVTAEISDGVMVNSLNAEPDHLTGDQDIVKVVVYLDVHPDDFQEGDLSWEMSPLDGEFDSSEEVVEVSLSMRDLSASRHVLHVQAIDFDGYLGPVKSVSIEVEKEETNSLSNYPTSAPLITALPTSTSQSPNPTISPTLTTAEPIGILTEAPPSKPNTTLEPSSDPTTTSSSPNPSQSPSLTTPSPTLHPKTTSFPTTLSTATTTTPFTSIPSNTPTNVVSSSLSTNFPTAGQTLPINVSSQSTTTEVEDIRNKNSSSAVVSGLRLMMMTACVLTS
ncbi:M14 family carboxypeptidase, partial [Skeletonema marinoi]